MKRLQTNMFKVLAMLAIVVVALASCQKEEEVFPAPTISSSGTLAGIPGATVTVKASINAPAGIKSVTVLKNGAAFDSKIFTGEKTAEYSKDYVIEGTVGSSVTFTVVTSGPSDLSYQWSKDGSTITKEDVEAMAALLNIFPGTDCSVKYA